MVAFDYTFTDREANTSTLVLAPMQALEGCKDSLRIRLRETEAVIANRECPFVRPQLSGHMNSGRLVLPPILDGVADQVQEDLTKLLAVEGHWRKVTVRHNSAAAHRWLPGDSTTSPEELLAMKYSLLGSLLNSERLNTRGDR